MLDCALPRTVHLGVVLLGVAGTERKHGHRELGDGKLTHDACQRDEHVVRMHPSGAFVDKGRIAPGGVIPVNTNGGGLSYCHPGMYGLMLLIEAVRQLRGECGARQISGAETAIAHGNGGVLSSESTVILGLESTL